MVGRLTKRARNIQDKIEAAKVYPVREALQLLKDCSTVKFDESVDIAVNLGIDPRKPDQLVRGSMVLPKGTGKPVRVAVFAQGDDIEVARSSGADSVGYEDLFEQIQGGDLNYQIIIATPDCMPLLGKLGRLLGPRGLMPNPKLGTVTKEIKQAVENAKAGQIQYRADKNGIIHCAVGKLSFSLDALLDNIHALLIELKKAKPSAAKGIYMKISLSTTMGPGLVIEQGSLSI